ncbi:TolC family protein [Pseudothauera nasutitermitis]|uniref:TolC family protein n=2 Tax=Pseudothauera nasutitermitis TaxID=2565930 RepID=A0A4S4ARN1_9RHOO|nr:TolC family protein [Pseudothauera nasutitermitis]
MRYRALVWALAASACAPTAWAHEAAEAAPPYTAPAATDAARAPAPIPPTPVTFEQARDWLYARSDQLAAANEAIESARLRREGMQRLGGPSVAFTGLGYAYSTNVDLDLDPARRALGGAVGQLPTQVGGAVGQLPSLPNSYNLQRKDENATASLSVVWPLYVGGFSDAVRGELDALTDEALADAAGNRHALASLLVQRYFGAQLAERAAQLHERALDAVREHDAAAQGLLDAGMISQVERLQAQAALADARHQARQARDAAELAATALARSLKAHDGVQPASPLFVHSRPLPPLAQFIEAAQRQHPGLDKVQAKKRQAEFLHEAQEALRRPQVLAFGSHEVNTVGKPNWVAGVAVRWSLWDSIDRNTLARASLHKVAQAERSHDQALSDIALLVEKNWLDVEHARGQYLAQQTREDLAREVLRLRTAGLREGTSTTLELIDAQLDLARVQTQRAATANQYVQALAALLESTGQSEQFPQYLAQADILISPRAP